MSEKKVRVRKPEDPEKVYARQQKYRSKTHKIEVTPITEATKARYLNLKGSMTHEEFITSLLDKFEGK